MSGASSLDPLQRFADRADDYARFRPTYPAEILEAVLEGFDSPVVADVGAGTGISARLLAAQGARVYAIEPNASMREMLVGSQGIEVVSGTAESTGLADGSVDIVAAFQAYHWFDVPRTMPEFARIVRRPGRFAAVWNRRDLGEPFGQAFERVIDAFGRDAGAIDRARRSETVAADFERTGCTCVRAVRRLHRQPLDWDSLLGFARSASYLPREGPAYDALEAALRELVAREPFAAGYAFTWETVAYLGDRQ